MVCQSFANIILEDCLEGNHQKRLFRKQSTRAPNLYTENITIVHRKRTRSGNQPGKYHTGTNEPVHISEEKMNKTTNKQQKNKTHQQATSNCSYQRTGWRQRRRLKIKAEVRSNYQWCGAQNNTILNEPQVHRV